MNSRQRRKKNREVPVEQRDEIEALSFQYRLAAGVWPRKRRPYESPADFASSLREATKLHRELLGLPNRAQNDIMDPIINWVEVQRLASPHGAGHLAAKAAATQAS